MNQPLAIPRLRIKHRKPPHPRAIYLSLTCLTCLGYLGASAIEVARGYWEYSFVVCLWAYNYARKWRDLHALLRRQDVAWPPVSKREWRLLAFLFAALIVFGLAVILGFFR